MSDVLKVVLLAIFVVVAIVLGPIAVIWSLNTLFPIVAIGYTWQTWLAAAVLFGGVVYRSK